MRAGHMTRHPAPDMVARTRSALWRSLTPRRSGSGARWLPLSQLPSSRAIPAAAMPAQTPARQLAIELRPCRRRQAGGAAQGRRTQRASSTAAAGAAAAAQQAAQSSLSTLLMSIGVFVMTCAVAVFLICAVPTLIVRACPYSTKSQTSASRGGPAEAQIGIVVATCHPAIMAKITT